MAGRVPHVSTRGTLSRLNWRVTLVQFLANTIVIGLLIVLLPGFELHATHELLAVLWLAAVFGVLTALVRPVLEFLFLPYVLQSLGLVMVAINAILLALLALTSVLEIDGVVPLLIGAVVAGVVGFFLDSVLGLTPPVVDDPIRAGCAKRASAQDRRRLRAAAGDAALRDPDAVHRRPGLRLGLAAPRSPPDAGVALAYPRARREAPAAGQDQAPAGGPRADLREARPDHLESGARAAARVGGRAGEAPERGSPVRLRRRARDRHAVAGRSAGDAVRLVQPDAARGRVARTGARGDNA